MNFIERSFVEPTIFYSSKTKYPSMQEYQEREDWCKKHLEKGSWKWKDNMIFSSITGKEERFWPRELCIYNREDAILFKLSFPGA